MLKFISKIVGYSSTPKGSKIILVLWLAMAGLFSILAPGSSEYALSSKSESVKEDTPAYIANQELEKQFPSDGMPGLLVFHRKDGFTAEDKKKINEISKWLASDAKPKNVVSSMPFHQLPPQVQESIYSKDKTTFMLNFSLPKDSDSTIVYDALQEIKEKVKETKLDGVQFEITGPAGITSDTKEIFKNADFVLMLGTVVLIFIVLIAIYRSPILAITPLIIAGIVYAIVDRIIGFAGKEGWFTIDKSALSIMLVLLFAVLTDYSLFIFSRYKEELAKYRSKHEAMSETMHHMFEPIAFSAGTVLLSVLTLFVTVFKPYNYFAPVFSIALVVIIIAGLTLIPSIFTILGRKAFWPFIPKEGVTEKKKSGVWKKVGNLSTTKPVSVAIVLIVILGGGALSVLTMNTSFNTLKSFPSDMSSLKGLNLLSKHYSEGDVAPVNILLKSNKEITVDAAFLKKVRILEDKLEAEGAVSEVKPAITDQLIANPTRLPNGFLSESKKGIKLQVILKNDPYEVSSINLVQKLRDDEKTLLKDSGFSSSDFSLYFAGETANQVDVRDMNKRDTVLLISLVTILITLTLAIQTRNIVQAVLMMGSILLSYAAAIGFSWLFFKYGMGLEDISYRMPLYTFVFMVALGVDYNIMLISRIKEEAKKLPWAQAVSRGVELTGGVISSAGLILAATFAVLITQPLADLYLFGMTMAFGILMDTFIVRGFFLPSLLVLVKGKKANDIVTDQKA